jgi:MoxR-like ATPase
VIFDEISRCRPEVQNKLFPIVHERKVQGLALESLEHRWAAMNPPPTDGAVDGWIGSEPLDAALADRFAFIVRMPAWSEFSIDDRRGVIAAGEAPLNALECAAFARRVEGGACGTRGLRDLVGRSDHGLRSHRRRSPRDRRVPLSPRRANYLRRNILAVHAVFASAGKSWDPSEATFLALASSMPRHAEGREVPVTKLKTAHREALKIATLDPLDPLRVVFATAEPLRRLEAACGASWASRPGEFSNVVIDVLAELHPGARDAAAAFIVEGAPRSPERDGRLASGGDVPPPRRDPKARGTRAVRRRRVGRRGVG